MDQDGRVAAVRCRAALDEGVEVIFEGAAPGYRLEEAAQAGKTAGAVAGAAEKTSTDAEAAVDFEHRGGRRRGGGVGGELERMLEEGVLRPAGVRRR